MKIDLSDPIFLLDCLDFRDFRYKKLNSHKEAKKFLIAYLTLESIFGIPHSNKDKQNTYKRVRKLFWKKRGIIFSEDLPLLPGKTKKSLDNVYYIVRGSKCIIENHD